VQAALVVVALAVLFAAILHNGWFADIHRRLSELANRGAPAPDDSADDSSGDDAVTEGDELSSDAESDEDGRYSAREGPEKGDL
jgi:hypothetical protein